MKQLNWLSVNSANCGFSILLRLMFYCDQICGDGVIDIIEWKWKYKKMNCILPDFYFFVPQVVYEKVGNPQHNSNDPERILNGYWTYPDRILKRYSWYIHRILNGAWIDPIVSWTEPESIPSYPERSLNGSQAIRPNFSSDIERILNVSQSIFIVSWSYPKRPVGYVGDR
jgi:hypothetical protein